jgi:hypothetical protein
MTALTFNDLATPKLTQAINSKEPFEVVGLGGQFLEAVRIVEKKIELTGMTCRIYTVGRIGLAVGSLAGGFTGIFGLTSATSIAIHNLLTFDPDYEIQKYPTHNRFVVQYKKKKK